MIPNWFSATSRETIPSPSLLVDVDRVVANFRAMIQIVGGPAAVDRLRVHVKTHKMPDLIRMQKSEGISRFKVATLAEAEMVAGAGGTDILVAYPMVGPNLIRFAALTQQYPEVRFATIVDHLDSLAALANRFLSQSDRLPLFIDVDCGMHRTGIPLGPELNLLRDRIESHPCFDYVGLHVYDGHLHDPSPQQRDQDAGQIIAAVEDYDRANPSPAIVAGGTPTFLSWAKTKWQCSPGTPVLWDVGYARSFPEMPFSVAAGLLTRVVGKPGSDCVCLDLGHKAVASEMPLRQRVLISELPDARLVAHSEEHLVVQSEHANQLQIGDALLAFPAHICPSVALHGGAHLIRGGCITGEQWKVATRDR